MVGSEHYKPGVEVGGGRFKIIKKLGEGGMGVVCLAEDAMLGDKLALKFLSPQLGNDEEAMDDMMRETRKSRQLTHPNIVRIHDIYHLEGEAPFISMEVIEGQPLSSLKAEQMDRLFPWAYLEPIVAQMCAAIDYAHEELIVHRDLKPANVMIDEKGRVKLADFGLAATISDSMLKVSKDMGVSGTPSYMGPQQLAGMPSRETDDIYSLGATIYELLTSKPPFYKGDVLHQIREVIPHTVEERLQDLGLSNEVPAYVSAAITACLDKDPEKRPQSAGEVAEMMNCAAPSMSRRSIHGNANAAVSLDSPEASAMLTELDRESSRPQELPKFVDPPSSASSPSQNVNQADARAPRFELHCINQHDQKTFAAYSKEVIVGRSSAGGEADLRLDRDPRVSRKHARIFIFEGEICIEDLGSRTGVYVNEHRIAEPTYLRPEDIIRLGDTQLSLSSAVFELPLPAPHEASSKNPAATESEQTLASVHEELEETASARNGKLYAMVGGAAAIIVIGLVVAFSGGSDSSSEKEATQVPDPRSAETQGTSRADETAVSKPVNPAYPERLRALGFRPLITNDTLPNVIVCFSKYHRAERNGRYVYIADNSTLPWSAHIKGVRVKDNIVKIEVTPSGNEEGSSMSELEFVSTPAANFTVAFAWKTLAENGQDISEQVYPYVKIRTSRPQAGLRYLGHTGIQLLPQTPFRIGLMKVTSLGRFESETVSKRPTTPLPFDLFKWPDQDRVSGILEVMESDLTGKGASEWIMIQAKDRKIGYSAKGEGQVQWSMDRMQNAKVLTARRRRLAAELTGAKGPVVIGMLLTPAQRSFGTVTLQLSDLHYHAEKNGNE